MPSECMIGGLTVMSGEKTTSINSELHRNKIANTVARNPRRVLVFIDTNIFLVNEMRLDT